MNNPLCVICGHVNRAGAVACEACDARLDTKGWETVGDSAGGAREPFGPAGGPSSWAAPGRDDAGGAWAAADEIPAPPFKSAGDVISPMLALYRKHFTLVGLLVLVVAVPEALLQYGFFSAAGAASGPVEVVGPSGAGAAFAGVVLVWALAMVGGSLLSGALVYAVAEVQRAGRASARECLARGLRALPKVFLVTVLSTAVTLPGFLLFIVPGVILSLMFAVSVPAAVVEGLGPVDALKRSYELTKGYKGLIFVTYFLWGLLAVVLSWVVTWSFADNGNLDLLPTLLLQTAVQGMLTSTTYVLTVYVYLGLLRERGSRPGAHAFAPGAAAAG